MPLDYLPIQAQNAGPSGPRVPLRLAPTAWRPLDVALGAARVALLTSAAMRLKEQPAFNPPDDTSFRLIPADADPAELVIDHRSTVGTDARQDPEVVFPRAALRSLLEQGVVGAIAEHHLSFVGASRRHEDVEGILAPALAQALKAQAVDLALLVPY